MDDYTLKTPENCEIPTLKQAIDIFQQIADMKDIAFGYFSYSCEARAHIMCRRLLEAGLPAGKAWVFSDTEDGEDGLQVIFPDGDMIMDDNGNLKGWAWHVSTTLPVKMPDGSVQLLIFDPALFDGPVTQQQLENLLCPKNVSFTDFGEPPQGYKGSYVPFLKLKGDSPERLDSYAKTIMDLRLDDLKEESRKHERRHVFRSNLYGDSDNNLRGETWISEKFQQSANNTSNTAPPELETAEPLPTLQP